MSYEAFDVIVVPFPFTDQNTSKRRPALVVSTEPFHEVDHSICCMITTKSHSPWPGDIEIKNQEEAGLDHPSIVRLKLFTLDQRLIVKTIGSLADEDRTRVSQALDKHLSL
ncbi:MAG: type II toxin-antitoxin system PemK/MazF family toxin [bacterium]